jgi:glycosyltransferase involved in cell wall biosynthesis
MIDAFRLFIQRYPHHHGVHLVIAGDGTERADLHRRIAQFALGGRVHLLGWRDDITNLLGGFTIFSMSSNSEGTSLSLLEAMSCQRCPVVTDVGGNSAVLGESLRHRLVPARDAEALAAEWANALGDADTREKDAVVARERVLQAYSAEVMCRSYQRLYAEFARPSA